MVAILHSCPMTANQAQPLCRGVFVGQPVGQIVTALLTALAGLFESALAAHDHHGSGERKVQRQGFDGKGVYPPGLHSTVSAFGLMKKGVLGMASNPSAC